MSHTTETNNKRYISKLGLGGKVTEKENDKKREITIEQVDGPYSDFYR